MRRGLLHPATYALVGADGYNYSSIADAGNAYLYHLEYKQWLNLLNLVADAPTTNVSDSLGFSVALSSTHALVGSTGYDYTGINNTGNAYLYTLADGSWLDLLSTAPAAAVQVNSQFGHSVALSDTHALIGSRIFGYPGTGGTVINGAGNAWLYNISSGTWTGTNGLLSVAGAPTGQANAQFGSAVALSATTLLSAHFNMHITQNQGLAMPTSTKLAMVHGQEPMVSCQRPARLPLKTMRY